MASRPDGAPLSGGGSSGADPEAEFRAKVMDVHRSSMTMEEKTRAIQALMLAQSSAGAAGTSSSPEGTTEEAVASAKNVQLSYRDEAAGVFGCTHYTSGCQLLAPCCRKWYPCRQCHDAAETHQLNRYDVSHMLCMHCQTVQTASNECSNPECKKTMARYYCDVCHLWEATEGRDIYHCPKCRICRVGKGLGIDYFHCDKCDACMAISRQASHTCIEQSLHSDCVICHEYLFTSTQLVVFLDCGHPIHQACYALHIQHSVTCPLCHKSIANMRRHWGVVDAYVARTRMPEPYCYWKTNISCNDCLVRSTVPFHFVYHKCADCGSYNTSILSRVQREPTDEEREEYLRREAAAAAAAPEGDNDDFALEDGSSGEDEGEDADEGQEEDEEDDEPGTE